jgi:hypothetical protein
MVNKILGILIIIGILIISNSTASAQKIYIGVHSGVSKQYGTYSDYFHTTHHISGNIHANISPNILFGLNMSYIDWNLIAGNDIESLSYGSHWDTWGQGSIFEIAPTFKLLSNSFWGEVFQCFGLVGLGYYRINYNVEYYDPWLNLDPNATGLFADHIYLRFEHNEIGFFSGVGISLNIFEGMYLEVVPQYRIVLRHNDYIEYASLNIGFCVTNREAPTTDDTSISAAPRGAAWASPPPLASQL